MELIDLYNIDEIRLYLIVLCISASRILEALDDEVDPCDDFFEFACGAWNRKNIIPADRASYNTFGKLKDELDVILKRK